MNSPFFRSHWDLPARPRYQPSVRPIPVQAQSERVFGRPPKVVSIPVRFVGSERSRSDSAVKIQKVFRGFLVRKKMKEIAAIRKEVIAIEERISKEETVDLIRRDSRERLRVNEMLMSLLLRLDSVTGVDAGVRNCRRSVIKKAIALQELLDAVVQSGDENVDSDNVETIVETTDQNQAVEVTEEPAAQRTELPVSGSEHTCDAPEKEDVGQAPDIEINQHSGHNHADSELVAEGLNEKENKEDGPEGNSGKDQTESQSDSTQSPVEGEEPEVDNEVEGGKLKEESLSSEEGKGMRIRSERNRELLERMMEENEKMMVMMAELFERNEKQTRLLCSLSQRVERLERAFLCDKLRRMKKRNGAAGCVDSYENSPDNEKCGKR